MKSNEKIMAAIKQRKSLCDPFLTVSKILETGGMETWAGVCCERIAAAELIDGENVRIAFLSMSPDLELTAEGLLACRNILECYVAHDILADACEMLCLEESMRGSINELARILREMKWRDLFGICVKEDERMRIYAAAEIRQRLALAECREKLKELFLTNVYFTEEWNLTKLIFLGGFINLDVVEVLTGRTCQSRPL